MVVVQVAWSDCLQLSLDTATLDQVEVCISDSLSLWFYDGVTEDLQNDMAGVNVRGRKKGKK